MTESNSSESKSNRNDRLLRQWSFEWPILEVVLGGKSSIDLGRMALEDSSQAKEFLETYGYDVSRDSDRRQLSRIYIEAINFIARFLIPREWGKRLKPPQEYLNATDVIALLVIASEKQPACHIRQAWACAILRVMHTIAHLDEMERLRILGPARDQIMGVFERNCRRDANGRLWFPLGDYGVEIVKLELKRRKSRESMILKLLHKPANVADTIYDLIGVRIVTKTVSDAILTVKALHRAGIVSFPNTNPTRARNSLIRIEEFRTQLETLNQLFENRIISQRQYTNMVSEIGGGGDVRDKGQNPHSASSFQSIQITCRHRIDYLEPSQRWTRRIEEYLTQEGSQIDKVQARRLLENFLLFQNTYSSKHDQRTYFPFEIQIIDMETADAVQRGDASHDRYKKAQIRTARRRVLGDLLRTRTTPT